MLFYLVVDLYDIIFFFYVYTQKIFYVKKFSFKNSKSYTYSDCFNNQVNNLDDMEREQRFYKHKTIFF